MKLRDGRDYNDTSAYTEIDSKPNFLLCNFHKDSRTKVSLSFLDHQKKKNFSVQRISHKNIRDFKELSHKHVKTYNDEFKNLLVQKSVETFSINQTNKISENFSNLVDGNEDKTVFTSTPLHTKFNCSNRISKLSIQSNIASVDYNCGCFQALNFKTKSKCEENSLEDYVFHDISPTKIPSFSINKTEKLNSDSSHNCSGYMTYGNELLKENCDIDFDHSFNHVQRSFFRQRRREWYLNRYKNVCNTYTSHLYAFYKWQYIYKLLISIMIQIYNTFSVNVQNIISKSCFYFHSISKNKRKSSFQHTSFASNVWSSSFQIICYIKVTYYTSTQLFKSFSKQIANIFFSSAKTNSSKKNAVHNLVLSKYFNQALLGLAVFLFVVLIAHFIFLGYNRNSLPNLTENGVSNAVPFFLDEKEHIPAWRVIASNSKINISESKFSLNTPVFLILHSGRSQQFNKLLELFQVLFSLGYDLIIPKHQLYRNEVSYAWKSIKKSYPSSTAYLWGENLDSSILSAYAQDFCSDSFPVSGIVVSAEDVISKNEKLKVWSCNCTLVNSDGLYHKFNSVLCPLKWKSHESFYESIIFCLQALHL
ncbi:uncharacterized protein LOC101241803 isoform X2 [Hydra vulgaris]|uniref:Uncharacterized protein LOC101241803 isoform X2 n=1 Tax=Hydra vulgaris TaxID=6087 RepID=A0ABM4CJT1_HYDVU